MSPDQDRLLGVAIAAAQAGARQLRRRPTREVHKDGDPINLLTDRDLASQHAVFEVIHTAFPRHRLIGEEDGAAGGSLDGAVWTVDPLDGTSNFAHGQEPYGVSVGFSLDGQPIVGAIASPGRLAWAERGSGAFLRLGGRERQLRVSQQTRLDRALVLTGYGYAREGYPAWISRFTRVMTSAQAVRMTGSAVSDLISVASGAADVYWEDELQPWDWAAGALLVEEAGGKVSQIDGRPLGVERSTFLGTNGHLHDDLVAFLAE